MTIKELNKIGENEFYAFSLEKTSEVFDVLESLGWIDADDKNLAENNGLYSKFLDIADDKVANNAFPELTEDLTEKSLFLLRILRIRTSCSQYRISFFRAETEAAVLEKVTEATVKFEETKRTIEEVSTETSNLINKKSADAKTEIAEYLTKSEESFNEKLKTEIATKVGGIEPQLTTTVLTLMGVFSAVITIIMSVVITSTSWLNSANGASVVLAFIIPNLVVVFSVIVLLKLVRSKQSPEIVVISTGDWDYSTTKDKAIEEIKKTRRLTFAAIAIFTAILVAFSLFEIRKSDEPHTRYVLSQGMYECVKKPTGEDSSVLVIEFEFNGKNCIFAYDEKYFHNGALYYCEEHSRLE